MPRDTKRHSAWIVILFLYIGKKQGKRTTQSSFKPFNLQSIASTRLVYVHLYDFPVTVVLFRPLPEDGDVESSYGLTDHRTSQFSWTIVGL